MFEFPPQPSAPPPYGQPHPDNALNVGYDQPGDPQLQLGAYPLQGGQPYAQQMTAQGMQSNVVVVNQTTGDPNDNPSRSYLDFAICMCLCCCPPLGIVAIICAAVTEEQNARGNWAAAKSASKAALFFGTTACIFGPIVVIVTVLMI